MKQLANHPTLPTPKHVWLLDSKPGLVDTTQGLSKDVLKVLDAVQNVPLPIRSREDLYAYLDERGFEKGLQMWLASNMASNIMLRPKEFVWSFDIAGARALYNQYCTTSTCKFRLCFVVVASSLF